MKITTETSPRSISDLTRLFHDGIIQIPSYQRPLVWPAFKKRKLIGSVRDGYHIGLIYLHKRDDTTYEIIDGQQRLFTLYSYIYPVSASAYADRTIDRSNPGIWAIDDKKKDLSAIWWQ